MAWPAKAGHLRLFPCYATPQPAINSHETKNGWGQKMWNPWVGSRYAERRTLLLLESCYAWEDEESQEILLPTPDHPRVIVEAEIKKPLSNAQTINRLTRAVSGCQWPSPEQAEAAWNRYAYTNYVPVSVGLGSSARPTENAWKQAAEEWPTLISLLSPRTIIVLSKLCWGYMPTTQFRDSESNPFNGNKCNEGYRLANGDVAMCYVIQHPSRGLSFMDYSNFILSAEAKRVHSTISEIG